MNFNENKNNFTKKRRGFSLLEMLIICAIVAIMTGVLMVMTFSERTTKELETAGREMTAAIREAQNNALTGKQQGPGLPCAFRFILSGSDGYAVQGYYRDLSGANGTCLPSDADNSRYNSDDLGATFNNKKLLRGMTVAGYTSNQTVAQTGHESNYVAFVVPYGEFIDVESEELTDPSIGTEFILEKDGEMYHICVHSTGLIEEIGFVDNRSDQDQECIF